MHYLAKNSLPLEGERKLSPANGEKSVTAPANMTVQTMIQSLQTAMTRSACQTFTQALTSRSVSVDEALRTSHKNSLWLSSSPCSFQSPHTTAVEHHKGEGIDRSCPLLGTVATSQRLANTTRSNESIEKQPKSERTLEGNA